MKTLESKCRYVLGRDVMLDRISELCRRALISHLEYCNLTKEEWVSWATVNWKPILNCIPTISLLANKWLVIVFIDDKDATYILNSLWTIENDCLVLS